jgi:hypothetical protein
MEIMKDHFIFQHPIMCHPFFWASAQIHGQQCFLSAIKSLAHLISAITLAPSVSKAAAQFLTVISISAAHSTAMDSVHSAASIMKMGLVCSVYTFWYEPMRIVAATRVERITAIVFDMEIYN